MMTDPYLPPGIAPEAVVARIGLVSDTHMPERLAACDLMLCRAGAITVNQWQMFSSWRRRVLISTSRATSQDHVHRPISFEALHKSSSEILP